VLWDNDGTLVDSEAIFFEITRDAFARLGIILTKQIWGSHYLGEGKSSRDLGLSLGADREALKTVLEERNQRYRQILTQPPPLRPDVRETLTALATLVRMALVTGCHRDQLLPMHASSGLLQYFEVIVTGDDCSKAKPHPDLYLAALEKLAVPAERCLAVEDSPRGLGSAAAAGIQCIVVPTDLTRFLTFPGALSIEPSVSGVLRFL
jgi:HAD superfamily hydrolase (TIGR01509 family)